MFRDVLGWSARETAAAVELSVAAVNSALQRARPIRSITPKLTPTYRGHWRFLPTTVNHQPTLAAYLKLPIATTYRLFALDIFRIESGQIAQFHPVPPPEPSPLKPRRRGRASPVSART
ncbi:hypothetical protein AB0F43_09890 [Kribbella sp. NPDC023972]|uniref:hypothetical protein n=1 Tax=Kribbella sp. NPDC023972 TaxID=3154795 RepID=UPI0033DDD06B